MIPDFQSVMVPLLQLMSDGKERRHADLLTELATQFNLTDDEKRELLPSGRYPKFENRVRWAKWYLTKAGLLESTGHGVFRIAAEGTALLATDPPRLTLAVLKPLMSASDGDEEAVTVLLLRLKAGSPQFFEKVVVELLVRMGYGGSRRDAAEAVGMSGDGGIDGVIKEDPLGLDILYVQAKRWTDNVGRPEVQAFAGALDGKQARKGIVISTSEFSGPARDFVSQIEKKIVLIGGKQLASLMIEHGVGVSDVDTYIVKRIDEDFFEGEAPTAAPMETEVTA